MCSVCVCAMRCDGCVETENLSKSLIKCLTRTHREKLLISHIVRGKSPANWGDALWWKVVVFILCSALTVEPKAIYFSFDYHLNFCYSVPAPKADYTDSECSAASIVRGKSSPHHPNEQKTVLATAEAQAALSLFFLAICWSYRPKCYCCRLQLEPSKQRHNNYNRTSGNSILYIRLVRWWPMICWLKLKR